MARKKAVRGNGRDAVARNCCLFIVAFLVIGLVLGPNAGQVYSGTSAVGADTVGLYNDGMLDTRLSYFSLTVPEADASAVGGTITRDGDYCIHTFTSSGTFEPLCDLDVEVLVVAGGAGGGSSTTACGGGGGGGAGGLLHDESYAVTAQAYPVTVGSGGSGATGGLNNAANGENSVFGTLTAIGGGYGAYGGSAGTGFNGGSGGSGGGGGWGQTTKGVGGSGTAGQGYAGGTATQPNGGAGGGASEVGAGGATACGGDGLAYSISGTSTYYAGGGGGGNSVGGSIGLGGLGGGGDSFATGGDGTPNTGGGGAGSYSSNGPGGDGGSGIVIIRYQAPTSEVIDPGVSVGGEKLHYDGTLSSSWVFSDGVSYVDSVDVSTSVLGELPVIPAGTTQTIKIDQGLDYSVTYVPKSMSIDSSGAFLPGESLQVDTMLTDSAGNAASYQPAEMRVRLFKGDSLRLDDTVQSTSFIVPGQYLEAGSYQLKISYYGYEFGGWSNEILADFEIGSGSTEVAVSSSTERAPEGMFGSAAQSIGGLLSRAVSGWMDVPIVSGILQWILDTMGVSC